MILGCGACGGESTPSPQPGDRTANRPASAAAKNDWRPPPGGPLPTFTDVGRQAGFVHPLHGGSDAPKNWLFEIVGSGGAVLDYDGDGDMDVLLADGTDVSLEGEILPTEGARARLWRNDGDLRFTNVTEAAGIDARGFSIAAAAADYDGDGHVDFALAGYDCFQLFRNRGDGTFQDVTGSVGLTQPKWNNSCGLSWGDLDGDGLLDLFVANYVEQRLKIEQCRAAGQPGRSCRWRTHTVYCGPTGLVPQPNRLYFQNPDHTFRDVSDTHLKSEARDSFQGLMADLDGDGDLDVYVTNDGVPNAVLVNDGSGVLEDRGVECGAATNGDFTNQASMGVDVADYDHDGRLDVFVTNFANEHNTLYRNRTRPGRMLAFDDVSVMTRVSLPPQDRLAWGTKLFDYDNDGELDCFVACGHVYPEEEVGEHTSFRYLQPNLLLRGGGPPRHVFTDVTERSGAHFRDTRLWRGALFADFDDDGDWDVLVTSLHQPPALLRNDGGNRNAWIRFDLRGKPPMTTPAGARVRVHLDDERVRTEIVKCGSSFASSEDPRVLVGVGRAKRIALVEILWPDGTETRLEDLETRRTHVVRQR